MLKKKRKQRKEREKKVIKEKRVLEDGENAMRWREFSGLSILCWTEIQEDAVLILHVLMLSTCERSHTLDLGLAPKDVNGSD